MDVMVREVGSDGWKCRVKRWKFDDERDEKRFLSVFGPSLFIIDARWCSF